MDLYAAIGGLDRVLACAQTSATWAPAFLPIGIVYSHTVIIFATNRDEDSAILQSSLHQAWKLRYGPSLRTDPRYAPSDCFDTFVFPTDRGDVEAAGALYHNDRMSLMRERGLGLTALYNLFNNPECRDLDIQRLRDLHVELDASVLDAYKQSEENWSYLDLQHDWHKTVTHRVTKSGRRVEKTTWRFTISERAREEILRRLLELNHQRYREEVEKGLHEPKKASSRKRRKPGGSGRRRKRGGGEAGLFD